MSKWYCPTRHLSIIIFAGVSNFASSSSHFGPSVSSDGLADFEFKDQQQQNVGLGYDNAGAADTSGSETGYQSIWTYPPDNNANAITSGYNSNRYIYFHLMFLVYFSIYIMFSETNVLRVIYDKNEIPAPIMALHFQTDFYERR